MELIKAKKCDLLQDIMDAVYFMMSNPGVSMKDVRSWMEKESTPYSEDEWKYLKAAIGYAYLMGV